MTETAQRGLDIAILATATDGRIGVLAADGPVALPRVSLAGDEAVVATMRALLGDDHPAMLRFVAVSRGEGRRSLALVELEPADVLPAGLAWRSLPEAELAKVEPAEARGYLGRLLAERRDGPTSPARPPWSVPGWHARAAAWMTRRLAQAGTPVTAPPMLHSLWGLSAVLRAETTDGLAWLKACSLAFPTEPAISRTLATATPTLVPAVVAIDESENWLLMRDIGQRIVGDMPIDRWGEGLAALARIQRAWLSRTVEPAADIFERRGTAELAAILPGLPDAPVLAAMAGADRERLRAAVPDLLVACRRLGELGPPPTVVHGDLHPWNVVEIAGRIVIFDWSDTSIGHPFLDLTAYLGRTEDRIARRAMLDTYLDHWSDVGGRDELEEAARLALALGAVHQIESYRRIMDQLHPDDRWDLDEAAPEYALQCLAFLEHGVDATIKVHD